MNILDSDPATQIAFSVSENKGVFALLLGSGISRAAEIPTGWEITVDLIRRLAAVKGTTKEADWAKWYRENHGAPPNYSLVLESLAASPMERRSILQSYIEPTAEDRDRGKKTPTLAHQAIADLVASGHIRVIVTTNFDRLLENSLRDRGIEPTIVASVDALSGAEPITHSVCYILKLHGDYKDARIRNTESELAEYPPEFDRLLDRIFDDHGLIICGWSGEWDTALQNALMRAPNRRYPIYWAARDGLGTAATDLANHRKARIVRIADANTFFQELRDRIQVLERARWANPQSVQLSVANTKRLLSKPEYRIELDELIAHESERLLDQMADHDLQPRSTWSTEEFRARVQRYEAISEPLTRIAGVLGRWGDNTELLTVHEVVRALYSHAEQEGSGLVAWLNLRSYPAALISTAYSLGLARAQKWNTLHKYFCCEIARYEREPAAVAHCLSSVMWKGADNGFWKHLEGLENRKTAFSDHMLDVFQQWGDSFIGLKSISEWTFELFELLSALAHFERNDLDFLAQAKASRPGQQFASMPLGRVGWHTSINLALVREIQNEPMKQALLSAGFAKGNPQMFALFFENLTFASQRMQWL